MMEKLCDPGQGPPLLSSLEFSSPKRRTVAWQTLPLGSGSATHSTLLTFPEECSLSLPAACGGLLLGESITLLSSSICNHYLFIFGS